MDDAFQGPENLTFEHQGWFEEYHDVEFNKYLGMRVVDAPNRLLGSQGAEIFFLTDPIKLKKGTKEYVLNASWKRPVKVRVMLQLLCGRTKPEYQFDFLKEMQNEQR